MSEASARSLFPATTLKRAISRLGFVQADPIRAPARAQDLILRHRVKDYAAGDLERRYPALDIEEDVFYAYGFLPRANWRLLHPRDQTGLGVLEQKVLAVVRHHGRIHPRELESELGRARTTNAWGGYSKATTKTLERLHFRGLLRIGQRQNGIRLYEAAPGGSEHASPGERSRALVLLAARIFAPVPEPSLREILRLVRRSVPGLATDRATIGELIQSGELEAADVDGLRYVRPAGRISRNESAPLVRFLAPFDPLVWDRRRFEHLWGWRYRFEAYTPPAKRKLGYYAMPIHWRDRVIGWANVARTHRRGAIEVQAGYAEKPADPRAFREQFEAEVERMRVFLGPTTATLRAAP